MSFFSSYTSLINVSGEGIRGALPRCLWTLDDFHPNVTLAFGTFQTNYTTAPLLWSRPRHGEAKLLQWNLSDFSPRCVCPPTQRSRTLVPCQRPSHILQGRDKTVRRPLKRWCQTQRWPATESLILLIIRISQGHEWTRLHSYTTILQI